MSEYARYGFLAKLYYDIIYEMFFLDKTPAIPESELPDQTGKVWIVTGSTSGIGFEVAQTLAKLGAHVWIVGRNTQKTAKYVDLLKSKYPSAKVDSLIMDLADLTTIKPGLEPFLKSGSKLNGIVHNAGVMFAPVGSKTVQGYDLQLGTNCLGPWLIQRILDPVLIKSSITSEGRIVWVSSAGHLAAPYDGDSMNQDPFKHKSNQEAYFVSKAINAMQAIQWTKLHSNANVRSVSCHPGVIQSDLVRHRSWIEVWIASKLAWPTVYGAYSEIGAALGDVPNNSYIVPWGKVGELRNDIKSAAENSLNVSKFLDTEIKQFE